MQRLKILLILVIISPLAGCISSERNDVTRLDPYLVKDINSGYLSSNPSEGVPIHQTKFVFPASDGSNGTTLWITDGTEKGTNMISGISIDKNADYSDSPNFELFLLEIQYFLRFGMVRILLFGGLTVRLPHSW